ncbi:hypothetical protein FB451DRAFT_1376543 [Mycena latifolia]|nr:hypothetical protein FB451DRAFT_1376543 [Mycena latifolia]
MGVWIAKMLARGAAALPASSLGSENTHHRRAREGESPSGLGETDVGGIRLTVRDRLEHPECGYVKRGARLAGRALQSAWIRSMRDLARLGAAPRQIFRQLEVHVDSSDQDLMRLDPCAKKREIRVRGGEHLQGNRRRFTENRGFREDMVVFLRRNEDLRSQDVNNASAEHSTRQDANMRGSGVRTLPPSVLGRFRYALDVSQLGSDKIEQIVQALHEPMHRLRHEVVYWPRTPRHGAVLVYLKDVNYVALRDSRRGELGADKSRARDGYGHENSGELDGRNIYRWPGDGILLAQEKSREICTTAYMLMQRVRDGKGWLASQLARVQQRRTGREPLSPHERIE